MIRDNSKMLNLQVAILAHLNTFYNLHHTICILIFKTIDSILILIKQQNLFVAINTFSLSRHATSKSSVNFITLKTKKKIEKKRLLLFKVQNSTLVLPNRIDEKVCW